MGQQGWRERHSNTASRRPSSKREDEPRRSRSTRATSETTMPYRERPSQPYARSNVTVHMPTPRKPTSPHVHFASPDRSNQLTKDASTQTDFKSKPRDRKSSKLGKEEYVKRTIEKELPGGDKVYAAAQTIKKAARRGTWDGSVVEEVFMEMTGVSMGPKDYMKSNWGIDKGIGNAQALYNKWVWCAWVDFCLHP